MKRKFLSLLISLCMVLTMVPTAFAETDVSAETLQAQINALDDGATIKLEKDYNEDIRIAKEKTLTLDLNGHTLTNVEDHTITNYGTLTIIDSSDEGKGTVDNVTHAKAALHNAEDAKVTLRGGSFTRSKEAGNSAESSGGNSFYTLQNYGTMTVFEGVSVSQGPDEKGQFSSLVENGYYNGAGKTNTPKMVIEGGTFIGGLNTIKNDDRGELEINGGIFMNYAQAMVQNHNVAKITEGTFTAAESGKITYAVDNCGCAAEMDKGTLTITGGKFSGSTYGVYDRSTQSPVVSISGGIFSADNAAVAKHNDSNANISITGGEFNTDVSAFVADGYIQHEGVVVPLTVENAVAQVGEKYYATLEAAFAQIPANNTKTTITLLKDAQGGGVQVKDQQNVVLDLNGHTYTVGSPTVGSAGTETNGFQLLKGSTVTIRNGTVKASDYSELKIMFQNYCDLILEDVTLDASKAPQCQYVSSNNFGSLTLKGDTNIYAYPGQAAFDLWYGLSSIYYDGITVTADDDFTGTVQGKIEYGAQQQAVSQQKDWKSKTKLEIKNGNFNVVFADSNLGDGVTLEEANIVISGGYFTSDPSEYTADGYIAVASDKNGYAYKVEKKTETTVPVEPAVGESNVSDLPEEIPENAAEAVKEAAANIAVPEISAAAAAEANQISDEQASEIKQNSKFNEADDAKVEVRAYLDIEPEAYSEDSYKLNITPVYEIVVTSGEKEDVVEQARPLDIKGTTTVSIPLPAEFVTSADDVYVQHKGYEYIAEVMNTGDNYTATFTNPHGFSEFTITKEPAAEAVLNGVRYNTLKDALDAAKDGETVTVLKDGLSADMSGNSRTIMLKNDTDNEIKVTVNGKEYLITSDGETEVSYTRPSSGGGGSVTTYAVTVEDTDNGTVTASVKSSSKGSTVTLTVKPDEGYQLDQLTVTDKDGEEISLTEKEDGKYTFTMPASEVSVSAAFTKSEEKPEQIAGFTDVLTTDWFADAVQYAVDNGMMNGTSETTFRPNGTTTRGMIVTILYRLEKEPAVDNGAGFADVAADQYYADAVAWASANDIVTGYSEEKFGPDDSITREQFAAILYRYAQYKKIDVTATADLSGYADAAQISAYAETAMKWANGEGLITGVTDTMLKPAGNATRAQAATILMRFCEEVAK